MKTLLSALAATLALCAAAQAQSDYPNKPVKIIINSAPGSATDVATRLMAERLGQVWGQQAVVDNRPGAGGSIAVRAASQAAPDGYTLYVGAASTFTALKGAPGVAPNLPIELPRDFAPIGFITQQPMFIAVSPKIGVKSLPELIALAKKKPGELSYATTGRGRITHLTMELLQERAGIKLQMIPYTGGPTAAMADVGTGRVAIVIEGYSGLAGGLTSGSSRASRSRRSSGWPISRICRRSRRCCRASSPAAGTCCWRRSARRKRSSARPAPTCARRSTTPSSRAKLAALGAYLHPMTPEQVTAFAQEQQKTWRPVAEKVANEMARTSQVIGEHGASSKGQRLCGRFCAALACAGIVRSRRPPRRRPFPTGRSRSSRRSRPARRTTWWRA